MNQNQIDAIRSLIETILDRDYTDAADWKDAHWRIRVLAQSVRSAMLIELVRTKDDDED